MKKTIAFLLIFIASISFTACNSTINVYNIDIMRLDFTSMPVNIDDDLKYLYQSSVVDNREDYLAHPDSILLNNGNILTFYPDGHGRGAILNSLSYDNGITWNQEAISTPHSWKKSEETPTVYRLNFINGQEKLILISANPKWPGYLTGDGFNVSISEDDGESFTDFKKYYGRDSDNHLSPIVAMSSLTRLKENEEFVDKWMGLFHDHRFINYKTILTFDQSGEMNWSVPEPYFALYRKIEKQTMMCEVEIIRSDNGLGNQLCLISRSNSKKHNSLISFSNDEGESWSQPIETVSSLSGERHKAQYVNGRLFITFRSIERDNAMVKKYREKVTDNWYSEGWVAWVGTYNDLVENNAGEYRIRLAHTYIKGQSEPQLPANADTGYAGVVMLSDNTLVVTSYGTFGELKNNGKGLKTYIISKRIRLEDVDRLANKLLGQD